MEFDYGYIYDDWFVLEGEIIKCFRFNCLLVEVELVFVMKEEFNGLFVNVVDVI